MSKLLALLLATALVLSGCTAQPTTSPSTPAPEPSSASTSEVPQLTDAQRERYTEALAALSQQGAIIGNWSGTPISSDNHIGSFEIVDAAPTDNGLVAVTIEIYAELYLDTDTMQESISWGDVPILTEGLPYSPAVAIGKSTLTLRDIAGGVVEPVSCRYEPYQSPGINYLKEQAAKNPPPADSPKLDITKYDPTFVSFIWKQLLKTKFIEKPADITHADLEGITGNLDISYDTLPPIGDTADVSLLRLVPNLTNINCYVPLKDYSVFEGMNKLQQLTLRDMDDARMATLRVGHTDKLYLDDPDCDVLDLTNVNTDTLSMMSYSTAVRGFAGCERVKNLYIHSTRTDMTLVNATAFPSVEYLNLQFYSDFERARDFSQLATFPDGTVVDIMLSYMACNDKTVATLAGVKPRLLVLSPNNGDGNRPAPPAELITAAGAGKIIVADYGGSFGERTKDSVA